MRSETPALAVRPALVTRPGLAIHVGADVTTTPEHVHWPGARSCRDTLERTSRLAAAAGITRQRRLLGLRASRAGLRHALRHAAAELDPRGHLLLAFTGESDRGRATFGRPPEVAWRLSDGTLSLTEVATLLGTAPPAAFITVIADTCYAGALARFAIPATVVLFAACGADQEIPAHPATGFAARLEQLVLADGKHNPACTSYLWLTRQFRRDSPDVEGPLVWTNRPFVWSQRPFRPISGPSRPARSAAVLTRPGVP
jgi:hypothetical protein